MSYANDIRMLLDIQDLNITFEEGCLYDAELKGKPCRYVEGKLTYTLETCTSCGVKNEDYTIYKMAHNIPVLPFRLMG